jgi:hypothetical protein
MARMTKEQRLAFVHQEALNEFDNAQSPVRDERLQCLQDRRFYSIAGAQWEGPLEEQFENKPRFEVNKIHLSVMRIINEYRNNRIAVDFLPREPEYDNLADTLDGLFRADCHDSCADEAFDNAFEEAVGGGFGAFRLRTEYEDEEDEDNEHQRIRIEPIFDADSSVFFDVDARRQDKADARFCFVIYAMTREAYAEAYDDDPSDWPKEITQVEFDWCTPDVVYIAEYYKVEEVTETLRIYEAIDGTEEKYRQSDFDADPELEDKLAAIGSIEVRKRRVKRKRVHKYLMSGGKVLEDLGYIAGKCIPIIPVYGKRWVVDNVERCMGHVRLAKDAQRLKNMQLSKLAEVAALGSVEKPILLPEQVAGHQMMWAEDNLKDYPYLLVNPITGPNGETQAAGPVAYTRSPQIPQALAGLLQLTEADMDDILGGQGEADKMVSNISGKAVELIQERIDKQAYIYMSNFGKAMQRCGEVWLSMAQEVYTEEKRRMKTVSEEMEIGSIELMTPTLSEIGEVKYENDLSDAKMDVFVDVGPTSESKRASTVRALTGMMAITQDPQTMQVLSALSLMNMEGEGLSDVRKYFRNQLIRMGAVEPTEEEQQQMMAEQQAAQQQEDPNAVFLKAAAEEAVAKAQKARADVIETIADAEYKQAKAAETYSKIDNDAERLTLDSTEQVARMIRGNPGR